MSDGMDNLEVTLQGDDHETDLFASHTKVFAPFTKYDCHTKYEPKSKQYTSTRYSF